MFATRRNFTCSYPAERTSVARARHDLSEFAAAHGIRGERLEGLSTAISEAVTNAIVHAYGDAADGEVHVTAAVTGTELWILVADDGRGFGAPTRAPGLGWGLALIADATEEFIVAERADRGTEVRMRFALPGD